MKKHADPLVAATVAVLALVSLVLPRQAAARIRNGQLITARPELTVEGTVASVYTAPSGAVFFNLGRPAPYQTFTAIALPPDASSFRDPARWVGKYVRVSGVLASYAGRPAIALHGASQLALASKWDRWTSQYRTEPARARSAVGERVWLPY